MRGLPAAVLLAAVLLQALLPADALPAGWYRSDSIGLALEPLPGPGGRELPWALRVQRQEDRETRTLYQEGREVRRWELTPGLERVFEDGSLSEELAYDGAGRLTAERRHGPGGLRETVQYRWGPSGLESVESFDGEGRLLTRQRYELGPGGELRRVQRESAGGAEAEELALISAQGRVFEERQRGGGRALVSRYGPTGRMLSQETWRERELVETVEQVYDGARPLSTQRTVAGTRTLTRYDEQGREVSRQVSRVGKTVEEWSFRYDAAGNRVQALRVDERGTEQWSWFYDQKAALQREEYRFRGLLQKVVRYEAEERVEELYRGGLPFLVVHYRGGVKVLEEFLEGGQVVRRRQFEENP